MTGVIVSTPPFVELPPDNTSGTATLSGVTYQYALLNIAQTWTAKQTFPAGNISINAADISGNLPVSAFNGGAGASSSTYWRGDGTWATAAAAITPAALTKTDDTNVTLTLGGAPATALLQASSITVGWTGTLAASRGGTGLSALGTGVATALAVNVGSAGAFVTFNGALGTPSSGVATNLTGTAASLTAGSVTTNANLTGPITSAGNATSVASQTGTGTKFVMDASPALTGTPTAPTAAALTSTTQIATTAFVSATTREKLLAARTYYVLTTGSDSNTGLANTAGGAFLTIQKAVDVAVSLDGSTFDVTIQIGTGTYTGAVVLKSYLGSGTWTLLGDASTPTNVVISTTSAHAITSTSVLGAWTINGFKIQTTTSGYCVYAAAAPSIINLSNVFVGACASSHFFAGSGGVININTSYTVSGGGGTDHWLTTNVGAINATGLTITISGTPTLTYWARAVRAGGINVYSNTYSGALAAGTKKYDVSMNSWLESGGGTLPGSVAGTTATGGQYA